MEFENKSILTNMGDPSITIVTGLASCALYLAMKAIIKILNTLSDHTTFEGGCETEFSEENQTKINWFDRANTIDEIENSRTPPPKERFLKKVSNYINEASKEYKYNFFLRLGLEMFLELAIVTLLSLSYLKLGNPTQILSYGLSIIMLLIILWFMVFTFLYPIMNFAKIHLMGSKFCERYWSLFIDFKPTSSRPILLYNFFFCVRRLLYAFGIVFFKELQTVQAFFLLAIFLPTIAYLGIFRPFSTRLCNFFMVFNEITLLICFIIFPFFLSDKFNSNEIIGYSLVALIIVNTTLNIVVLWGEKVMMIVQRKKKKRPRSPAVRLNQQPAH